MHLLHAQSKKLQESADAMSETLLPEFQKRIAFDSEDLSNQYALDFDMYIKWKAVASLLPQANDRVLFQKSVGDMVLESIGADIEAYDAPSQGGVKSWRPKHFVLRLHSLHR